MHAVKSISQHEGLAAAITKPKVISLAAHLAREFMVLCSVPIITVKAINLPVGAGVGVRNALAGSAQQVQAGHAWGAELA